MASRAERAGARISDVSRGSGSRLGGTVRAALTDYYFNSMRLVAANVVWGAGAIAVVLVVLVWPFGGLLLLPILALPTAGSFRMAARIVRVESDAGLGDFLWPYRHLAPTAVLLGSAVVVASLILGTNVVVGLGRGEPIGWGLATLAAWGLVALWCGALVAWPLIVDPARAGQPLRARLRLAAGLLLVDPIRFAGLGLAVAIITVISIVLTAAILTVSISFVALIACRCVYPAADRLESALTGERA